MKAGSFSPVPIATSSLQSPSRSREGRGRLGRSSPYAVSLFELKAAATRCRSPKQFRELLNSLQTFIPYRNLVCGWGYSWTVSLGLLFNHSYPIDFLRWFLTKDLVKKSPVLKEWLRTNKTQVWLDHARRHRKEFDPELLERIHRENLQYMFSGGILAQDFFVNFTINMASEESCRAHVKRFDTIAPFLAQALRQACPRPLLTERERAIVERRAMGQIIKQIAAAQAISERTVRMHLQRVKKKLYTDDLVNAVVIAVRSGMLAPLWKDWRWKVPPQVQGTEAKHLAM